MDDDDLNLSNFFKSEDSSCDGDNNSKATIEQYHFAQHSYKDYSFDIRLLIKHPLWGNYLWNASKWMTNYLIDHPYLVKGMDILELGAGAALPSLVSVKLGAKSIIITDYPDQELIENIEHNCRLNKIDNIGNDTINNDRNNDNSLVNIRGLVWGDRSLKSKVDVVIMCDLVFNHSEHLKLLESMLMAFKNEKSIAYCTFTHHRPWLKDKDLQFLDLCRDEGLQVDLIEIFKYERVMFETDRGDPEERRTVYAYKIFKP